jgi:ATP phosphoribosyltransferase regulatory subunit
LAIHLRIGKGLRPAPRFAKGARSIEDGPVNATLLDATLPIARSAGERALEHFLAAGFRRIEPAILHPASIFLDMSGEAIRGRLFLTADAAGEELCLRPEYTIPVCRAYLASDKAGAVAEYSYLGPVFRAQAEGGGERAQRGL